MARSSLIVLIAVMCGCTLQLNPQPVKKFPYQAALIADASIFCSGAVISSDFVITSAKCVEKAFEVDVIVGSTDLMQKSSDEEAKICTDIRVHQDFDSVNNDLALVGFPAYVLYRDSIRSVQLPYAGYPGAGQSPVTVTGWSAIYNGTKVLTGRLNYAELATIMDETECRRHLKPEFQATLTTGIVCTEKPPQSVEDLGSPLVAENILVGILTQQLDDILVYTKIDSYSTWIMSHSTKLRLKSP